MKTLLTVGLFLTCLVMSSNLNGQVTPKCITPLQNNDKVLFIGNSLTDWFGPLSNAVKAIYDASGSNFNLTFVYKGKGCGIIKEYATWSSLGIIAEIRKGGWKYVVIQGWNDAVEYKDSPEDEFGNPIADYKGYPQCQDTMLKYLKILDNEIRKIGGTTILYDPHNGKWPDDTLRTFSKATYKKLRDSVSCFYINQWATWDSIRNRFPSIKITDCKTYSPGSWAEFMFHDCIHQNGNGMMLDALTFYSLFSKKTGATLKPTTLTSMTRSDLYTLFADVAYRSSKNMMSNNGCSYTDTQVPSVPSNLIAKTVMSDCFSLSWTQSTDDVGVVGYEVYSNDVLIGTTAFSTFQVGNLTPSTTYAIKIRAFDSDKKISGYSTVLNVTTLPFTEIDTAGILMSWDFKSTGCSTSVNATKLMPGISITQPSASVQIDSGFIAGCNSFFNDCFAMKKLDQTTLAGAISFKKYFSFTITPSPGNTISVDSISLRPFSQNPQRKFTLFSNVKGFKITDTIKTIYSEGQVGTSLQTIHITGHDNISNTLEFRVYVWSVNNTSTVFGLGNSDKGLTKDDLIVMGSVKSSSLPSFPTKLTATNLTETGFTLNWAAAKDAVSYEVYKDGISVGTSTTLSKAISGVAIGSIYSMSVTATDGSGTVSEESIPLEIKIPDLHAPSVPTNFHATSITQNSFTLYWDASTDNVGVVKYEVYKDGITEFGNTTISNLPMPSLMPNTSYSLAVRALDAYGNKSAFSTTIVVKTLASDDTLAPSVPANLKSSSVTSSSVNLSWTASTDNVAVTYYLVYIGGIKKDSSTTANISITGLSANTAYSFYVKAKDAAGNISASSSTLNITTSKNTDTQAPTAPSKPVSSNITGNSFTLSWSASTDNVGVVSYELYLGSDLIGTATGTTYTYSSAVPSTTYLVTIKAKDAAGNLSSACAIQVKTLAASIVGAEQKFTVYPNPASDFITIVSTNDSPFIVQLINMDGQSISGEYSGSKEILINIVGLPSGIYLVKTLSGAVVTVHKIQVEK